MLQTSGWTLGTVTLSLLCSTKSLFLSLKKRKGKDNAECKKHITDSSALCRNIRTVAHGLNSAGEGEPIEMGPIEALALDPDGKPNYTVVKYTYNAEFEIDEHVIPEDSFKR